MNSSITLAALITHCRKRTRRQLTPDAELLRRFAGQREADAFEELVERYAPLVWGVCRRILPRETDCEDAFQAAFLSLVRQAGSIDPNRPLGAWLHTIAVVPAAGVSLTSKLTLTAMSFVMAGVLGLGALHVMQTEPPQAAPTPVKNAPQSPAAEKPQPRLDRFGDPLPPGAIRRFGTLRFRRREIVDLAFTPDGKQLIAGDGCSPLAVFDAVTGHKLRQVGKDSVGANSLTGFALSPDGKRVACCGSEVFMWDLETGRPIRQLGYGLCKEAAFSPDGTKLAVALKETSRGAITGVAIVEAATGAQVTRWTILTKEDLSKFSFNHIAFSADGKFLAGCYSEHHEEKPAVRRAISTQVWLFDASTGRRVRTFGAAGVPISCFAFQPGTGRLATFGKDGILRFWDVVTGKEVQHFPAAKGKEGSDFGSLRFSSDGSRCAVLTDRMKYLTVVDAKDGRVVRRIEGKESQFRIAIALSADGKTVAAARTYDEPCVRVWDVSSGTERLADASHRAAPIALSLSSDGRILTSRDEQGREIHWELRSGKGEVRSTAARGEIGQLVWSRDYSQKTLRGPRWQMIYKNQRPAMIEVRSLDGAKLLRKIEASRMVPEVALSPDGSQLAIAPCPPDSTILLWDPEREEKPRKLPANSYGCSQLLFTHDGKRLIGRGGWATPHKSKGSLWIWDVATARVFRQLPIDTASGHLLLTADDRVLLIGGQGHDAAIHAWDVETGKEIARMVDPSLKPPSDDDINWRTMPGISSFALSANERFLAVISGWSDVSAVSIWETGSWKLVRAFAPVAPPNHVKTMIFSRAGRSLFVGNNDSTILEWDISGRFDRKTEIPNKDRLNLLWQTFLESPDKAYPAVWEMLDHSAESVPFLIEKVSPVKPVEEKRVRQLLAQLDSESFAEREKASRKLLALGEQIEPMLRQALKERLSLEVIKRVERVMESLNRLPTPDQLRLLRALAVLEWSNRPDAVEHLRRLAGGAPSALLTQAAQAAWQRRP